MWEKALELASKTTHPYSVVAFALVFAAMVLMLAMKAKKPRIAWLLASALLVLGISPLIASTYLASRGVYRISIIVLGTDGQPVDQADLTSLPSAQLKQASGNWEYDLAPQTKPSSGQIVFYASIKDAHLAGHSTLTLKEDYFPTVTIQLQPLPPATIRGTVVDESGKAVQGARVAVSGYPDVTTTDEMGSFSLPAHHAEGQLVSVHVKKGSREANRLVAVESDIQLVLR